MNLLSLIKIKLMLKMLKIVKKYYTFSKKKGNIWDYMFSASKAEMEVLRRFRSIYMTVWEKDFFYPNFAL